MTDALYFTPVVATVTAILRIWNINVNFVHEWVNLVVERNIVVKEKHVCFLSSNVNHKVKDNFFFFFISINKTNCQFK